MYNRIDVKNILFWNDNVSTIIKSILFDINRFVKEETSVLIILGIITFIIEYIITNKDIITKKDPIMKNKIKKQSTNKEKDKYNNLILDKETTTPTPKKSLFSFFKKEKEMVEENKDDNVIDELFGFNYNAIVTDNSTDNDNDQNSSNTPIPTNKNTSPKNKKKKKKKR